MNKIESLRLLLVSKTFKIILITESWLNSKIDNSQILHDTPYTIVRCDRGSKGGGVCILIDNIIPFSVVKTPKIKNSDLVVIDIYSPTYEKFRLILVYRPTTKEKHEDFLALLDTLCSLISINHNFIIIGDFNFPNMSWISGKP